MKTLLLPVDFSDVSGKVIETAASLAAALGSRVILRACGRAGAAVRRLRSRPDERAGGGGGRYTRRAPAAGGNEGAFGATEVLALQVQGTTAEKILSLAREHDAEMIVMGSHGHGALYHLFAGSVTTAVLKESVCPVLVVCYERVTNA